MVAILILNWNGWRDTVACLDSLLQTDYDDYKIFLGDNGSTNESKEMISEYCRNNGYNSNWNQIDKQKSLDDSKIQLLDLQLNNGFAKGNNLLITVASWYSPDYYLLLNNDTEVESDFLTKLVNFQYNNPLIKVLTPLIYYYSEKNKIWNAGGNLYWGIRKYHFPDQYNINLIEKEFIPCTFITGCALFCTPDVLMPDKKIFTELFFHGEEDFDFGLRMKRLGVKMGCLTSSRIFHKVGGTSGNIGETIGLTYCYYLNRFINLRHHLNVISFYTFIMLYFPYVVRLLKHRGLPTFEAVRFYWKVVGESIHLDGVSYDKFIQCVKNKNI